MFISGSSGAGLRAMAGVAAWLCACLLISSDLAGAEQPEKGPAEEVQDNSFLIEEAYNQDAGVVQHILSITQQVTRKSGADEREWQFVFTQEWPVFSQSHQLSYTVPYDYVSMGGSSDGGFDDVLLNYRYQALEETETRPAFAPRFSLVLPTGDASKGFGNETLGYQTNLPVSKIVSDRWTLHANAGATLSPDVEGHDLVGYHLGASAIYAVMRTFNLMLESTAEWEEEVTERGRTERNFSVLISPGFRYAFNHPNDAQTVIGVAAPIGLTSDTPDDGVIVYASFEHFFWRARTGDAAT